MAVVDQIIRALLLIRKIKSGGRNITLGVLAQYIDEQMEIRGIQAGTSESTLKRDLKYINDQLMVKIDFDRRNRTYYINNAHSVWDISELLDPFEILNSLSADTGLKEIVLVEKYRPKGVEHLRQLIYAIKQRVVINFNYDKFNAANTTDRVLEPYAIKQVRGRWYVVGHQLPEKKLRTFGLDRIADLIITSKKFSKDERVDIPKQFRDSFGIYSSDEYPVEKVVLSFDATDGSYLETFPLHSSQHRINTDNNNEFRIGLTIKITHDFVMELLSRSNSLKVIEPQSLRDKITEIYKMALERNT
jgi:predicted DNA-binding transcriptional regulator YafY